MYQPCLQNLPHVSGVYCTNVALLSLHCKLRRCLVKVVGTSSEFMSQVLPWILDVGYTIMAVALLIAATGHVLFGDFETTMTTLPQAIAGKGSVLSCLYK